MHRSGSANRFSDDHFSIYASSPSSKVPTALRSMSQGIDIDELPVYEPSSDPAKKEKSRAKFGESAVHFIPLILFVCAIILWFSSNPDVDMRNSLIAEEIEGMSSEGHLDSDGTGHLPVELGDMDPAKLRDNKATPYLYPKQQIIMR